VKTLTIATTNPGKVHEVRLALQDLAGWKIDPLPLGIREIEESGTTFLENATLKAAYYSRFVEGLALADDSGLAVDALAGAMIDLARDAALHERVQQQALARARRFSWACSAAATLRAYRSAL